MWIMLSDCFLSIVFKDCGPTELRVRARRKEDIQRVFPNAKVIRDTKADYLYRSVLPRSVVKSALAGAVMDIDYPNFKDSVEDEDLHAAYQHVWHTMADLQDPPPYSGRSNPKNIAR